MLKIPVMGLRSRSYTVDLITIYMIIWRDSQLQIVMNETHGSITSYEGEEEDYASLAHIPLQTPGPVYRLSDIVANIKNLSSDLVSFTAAVRSVSS